jgi:hypothetical protein
MEKLEVAEWLDVKPETLDRFEVSDIFNVPNTIGGFLCRQSDHRYGALVIDHVNGIPVPPQRIYCTPKLHYPFGETSDGMARNYHWPKVIEEVVVFEKLDGTNVCAYSYADATGTRYITFKTRLTPVLQSSKFGNFAGMWQELLGGSEELKDLIYGIPEVISGRRTMSFEMYGCRNKILVVYEVPLACKMLFTVDQIDASVYPPTEGSYKDSSFVLKPEAVLTSGQDLTVFYDQKRAEAEAKNVKIITEESEEVTGIEGYVFYVRSPEGWKLLKCKPPSIEASHWAGAYIPASRIIPTCWNALESAPDGKLTIPYIRELLLEEFSNKQVTASYNLIEASIAHVEASLEWRSRVQQAYAETGLFYETDGKAAVMRALSTKFTKPEMKRVYSTLFQLGVVK